MHVLVCHLCSKMLMVDENWCVCPKYWCYKWCTDIYLGEPSIIQSEIRYVTQDTADTTHISYTEVHTTSIPNTHTHRGTVQYWPYQYGHTQRYRTHMDAQRDTVSYWYTERHTDWYTERYRTNINTDTERYNANTDEQRGTVNTGTQRCTRTVLVPILMHRNTVG